MPSTLQSTSKEYLRLQVFARILELKTINMHFEVKNCYLDFGANLMWTTVIANRGSDHWQCLCPADWEKVVLTDNLEELDRIAEMCMGRYPTLYTR